MTHDDPSIGPVRSALTLRLWLAGFGLVSCAVGAGVCFVTGPLWLAIVLVVLAVVAVVDIVVIARRKRRGEPG
jgi:membrane protein implicated in regulation of membrane protease activity